MKLFEYEAKSLAQNLGIPTPRGAVASWLENAGKKKTIFLTRTEYLHSCVPNAFGSAKGHFRTLGHESFQTQHRAIEILITQLPSAGARQALITSPLSSTHVLLSVACAAFTPSQEFGLGVTFQERVSRFVPVQ